MTLALGVPDRTICKKKHSNFIYTAIKDPVIITVEVSAYQDLPKMIVSLGITQNTGGVLGPELVLVC